MDYEDCFPDLLMRIKVRRDQKAQQKQTDKNLSRYESELDLQSVNLSDSSTILTDSEQVNAITVHKKPKKPSKKAKCLATDEQPLPTSVAR